MRYLVLILGIFGLEYKIKNKIEESAPEGKEEFILKRTLVLRRYHNTGAFLDAGHDRPGVVLILSVLLAAILTVIFVLSLGTTGSKTLKWGLSFLLGGAYSNTYDRLARKYVVDYVSFNLPVKWLRRIVFNIADFCIMLGALLCVAGYYFNG